MIEYNIRLNLIKINIILNIILNIKINNQNFITFFVKERRECIKEL